MKLEIKVVPGAKKNQIIEEQDKIKVYLTAPAVDGKANEALIEFLAENYKVKKYQIEIIKGLKSRNKIINILT
jgi:uncharacterized protein (TIGR00251 family)